MEKSLQETSDFEQLYVDWETANVLLGDTAAIDLPSLSTPTYEDAHILLNNYGFNPDDTVQAQELEKLRVDALHFIEK